MGIGEIRPWFVKVRLEKKLDNQFLHTYKKYKVDQSTFMANFGSVNVDFKTGIYVLNEILI